MLVDDLEDFQEDEFTGSLFGESQQLEVLGWIRRLKGKTKIYAVRCKICQEDPELFGDSIFSCQKVHLESGSIPCGCSKIRHWTEEQYKILANRACERKGLIFEGWVGSYQKGETFCQVSCQTHGKVGNKRLTALLSDTAGCVHCARTLDRTDEQWISMFKDRGAYPEGSVFTRSSRARTKSREYWNVTCSACGNFCESSNQAILSGSLSCQCSKQRQQNAYIVLLLDNGVPVHGKLGITVDVDRRVKQLDRKSVYDIVLFGCWSFTDIVSCKRSESVAKSLVDSGYVRPVEMLDGYSETFAIKDLEKVIEVFEDHGGFCEYLNKDFNIQYEVT